MENHRQAQRHERRDRRQAPVATMQMRHEIRGERDYNGPHSHNRSLTLIKHKRKLLRDFHLSNNSINSGNVTTAAAALWTVTLQCARPYSKSFAFNSHNNLMGQKLFALFYIEESRAREKLSNLFKVTQLGRSRKDIEEICTHVSCGQTMIY